MTEELKFEELSTLRSMVVMYRTASTSSSNSYGDKYDPNSLADFILWATSATHHNYVGRFYYLERRDKELTEIENATNPDTENPRRAKTGLIERKPKGVHKRRKQE